MQGRELKLDDFPAVWENEPTSLSKLSVRGIWHLAGTKKTKESSRGRRVTNRQLLTAITAVSLNPKGVIWAESAGE